MKTFEDLVKKVNESMIWFAGILIILIGMATTYDILARKLFKLPTVWAFDFSSYGCAFVAFLSGGFALLKDKHVRIDIVYSRFEPRAKSIINIFTSIIFFIFSAVLVLMGFNTALESYLCGYYSSGAVAVPLFIPQLAVPIGGLLLGLQGIVNLINDFRVVFKAREE